MFIFRSHCKKISAAPDPCLNITGSISRYRYIFIHPKYPAISGYVSIYIPIILYFLTGNTKNTALAGWPFGFFISVWGLRYCRLNCEFIYWIFRFFFMIKIKYLLLDVCSDKLFSIYHIYKKLRLHHNSALEELSVLITALR